MYGVDIRGNARVKSIARFSYRLLPNLMTNRFAAGVVLAVDLALGTWGEQHGRRRRGEFPSPFRR
jgi:hypothetical protein